MDGANVLKNAEITSDRVAVSTDGETVHNLDIFTDINSEECSSPSSLFEQLCLHGQGSLFLWCIACRFDLATLSHLRAVSKTVKHVVEGLRPVIRAFKSWTRLRDCYDVKALVYHCKTARPPLTHAKARELFAIYAGHGSIRSLVALQERYHFTRADVVKPSVRPRCGYTQENSEPLMNAFVLTCRNGHITVAKWLTRRYALTRDNLIADEMLAMAMACKYGHLDLAQWISENYGITSCDVRRRDSASSRASASFGQLHVLEWLHTKFDISEEDARANDYEGFLQACANGHHDAVRFLVDRHAWTDTDVARQALRLACSNGHLDLARWLADAFDLTSHEALVSPEEALFLPRGVELEQAALSLLQWQVTHFHLTRATVPAATLRGTLCNAAEGGQSDVVRWAIQHFDLSSAEIIVPEEHRSILACAAFGGRLELLQWLEARFAWATNEHLVRVEDNGTPLSRACGKGQLEVVQWLVETYQLTKEDLFVGDALALACTTGELATVQWLATRFLLTADDFRHRDCLALRGVVLRWQCCKPLKRAPFDRMMEWLVQTYGLSEDDMEHDAVVIRDVRLRIQSRPA